MQIMSLVCLVMELFKFYQVELARPLKQLILAKLHYNLDHMTLYIM